MGSSSAISPSWSRWYAKRLRVRKAVGTAGPGLASAVSSRAGGSHGPQREEDHAPDDSLRPLRLDSGPRRRPCGGGHRQLGDPALLPPPPGGSRRQNPPPCPPATPRPQGDSL